VGAIGSLLQAFSFESWPDRAAAAVASNPATPIPQLDRRHGPGGLSGVEAVSQLPTWRCQPFG